MAHIACRMRIACSESRLADRKASMAARVPSLSMSRVRLRSTINDRREYRQKARADTDSAARAASRGPRVAVRQ
ncbi:hypothetical protein [Burkholderia oklahomensis]|uniref:hypothetical protein n=1 Tax=Burkholderia oklahomensis TaxID=342113 RepID=UPI00016A494D|nr:hypothetical protein [Burkholderia oklahomensis]AOI42350.1 hypothetical protein WG70_22395 [Burkholderia oklahomensis EO147]KUY52722.1 hypothetical protein WG70_00505 [Burkholderia oklahomensis EO147]QPS37088.1 hypothetical protein I6G57_17735 [Burkholderia oklahomensis]